MGAKAVSFQTDIQPCVGHRISGLGANAVSFQANTDLVITAATLTCPHRHLKHTVGRVQTSLSVVVMHRGCGIAPSFGMDNANADHLQGEPRAQV